MTKSFSQDHLFREWESLLAEIQQHQGEIAGVAPFRDALATAHFAAVRSRGVRDNLSAAAMEETRRLNEAIAAGRDAAACLRHYIKSVLGFRSEKLGRYGIKPFKRRRTARQVAVRPSPS